MYVRTLGVVKWICHISHHPCTDTQENANLIAAAVKVEYESLGPVIISTEEAVRTNSYIDNYKPAVIQVGDATGEASIVVHCSCPVQQCDECYQEHNSYQVFVSALVFEHTITLFTKAFESCCPSHSLLDWTTAL